ncbi:MAG: sigma-70 family RNA polymerase sigma factor [Desulfobulbaceae bacterium]|nr:sigma-70 family RNA polymerase sigma factor [Desulfobulbaceae bacterium]
MFRFRSRRKFQELTSPHVQFLYNMALRYTGNSYDAEDLVQETMCAALKSFSTLRENGKCKAWLLTILRRLFYKEQDKKCKRPLLLDDETYVYMLDRYAESGHKPELDKRESAVEVQRTLDGLPEKYKTPLLLFFMEDMSYKEIAETLELPMGTVMSRLSRAKHYFKKAMLIRAVSLKKGRKVVPIHPEVVRAGDMKKEAS